MQGPPGRADIVNAGSSGESGCSVVNAGSAGSGCSECGGPERLDVVITGFSNILSLDKIFSDWVYVLFNMQCTVCNLVVCM
ncbi:unnamed protein product, partial [Staurois parvus]